MASSRIKKLKTTSNSQFLSPEQSKTMKPADFKVHAKLQDLSQDDLIELLCLMEAELQAKDILLKAALSGQAGVALPLSSLLDDGHYAAMPHSVNGDEEEEIWLGEPSAHLNHVVAYHQVVREQMQSILESIQLQHKQMVTQLDEERRRHFEDAAQGDDVTYMLEKERERLQRELDIEQAKQRKLERERDKLVQLVQEERSEHQGAYSELMEDCKALALQVVQHSAKIEQLRKDVDKEKQKNVLLSELMVSETRKFKERLKVYEDECNDYHILEQKREDLEQRLLESERKEKDVRHQLRDEQQRNKLLQFKINQMQEKYPIEDGMDNGIVEAMVVGTPVEDIGIRQAVRSHIALSNANDFERDSPEPAIISPQPALSPDTRIATVQKSNSIRQHQKVSALSTGAVSRVSTRVRQDAVTVVTNHSDGSVVLNSRDDAKRHSYEEQRRSEHSSKHRLSYESQESVPSSVLPARKHNSQEEIYTVDNASAVPKRNSYEGDSEGGAGKRAPAPPRRVSSLSEKGPVVKVSAHQIQILKSTPSQHAQQNHVTTLHSRNPGPPGCRPVIVLVNSGYGWEYKSADEGLVETNRLVDLVAIVDVSLDSTWLDLTNLVNDVYEKECRSRASEDPALSLASILHYEYAGIKWTSSNIPDIEDSLSRIMSEEIVSESRQSVVVTIKGIGDDSLDDLSYSTMVSNSSLQECIRVVYLEKSVLFTVNEELEGHHFVSCLARWIKTNEARQERKCVIFRLERNDHGDILNLANMLLSYGVLQKYPASSLRERHILILNIDYLEEQNYTSDIYEWLSTRSDIKNSLALNGTLIGRDGLSLQKDVLVIAYATNAKVPHLSQCTYRVFKILSLPFLLPGLVHRWLRQKIINSSPKEAQERRMCELAKWLSDVYYSLHRSFFKLELLHKLPDARVYLAAPLHDSEAMIGWIKSLWVDHITPCVDESVRHRTRASPDSQQQMLVKVTLKALFEKSIKPGCPIDLKL